jgi:integrase
MRAKQGSVVLEARLGKEDGYKRVAVEFKKGQPVAPEGSTAFYARYSDRSKKTGTNPTGRQVEPLGADLTTAWIACQNTELKMHAQRLGHELPASAQPAGKTPPEAKSGTITAAVAEFVQYSLDRIADWRSGGDNGLAPNSFVAYKKAMSQFEASCAEVGAVNMSEFKNDARGEAIMLHFKKWLDKPKNVKRRGGKAAYSNARKFTIIGQFLARNGFKMKTDRTFNPNDLGIVDRVDVPRVKKPGIGDIVFYTPEDIKAMLAAADTVHEKSIYLADDLKDLVLMFALTGMRDEEIQHLTWGDINWRNGDGEPKVTIQDKPVYDWRVKDHEKRVVTLPEQLKKRLQDRQAEKGKRSKRHNCELIFPTSTGTPNQNFADHIAALQKRAETGVPGKLKPYTFSRPETRKHILHNFRKSYATMQMVMGIAVRNIQRDLGHSELSTTERYLAIVDNAEKVRKDFAAIA